MKYLRTVAFHHMQHLAAVAAIAFPATSFSLTATPAVEAAFKTYKQTGIVANELILENVNRLVAIKEDCKKNINELALASLTEEHRKELGGGSFVDGLPIAREIKLITNIVRLFSSGMSDADQARFAMEVGRGAAIRYRSERCVAVTGEAATGNANAALPTDLAAPTPSVASAASSAIPSPEPYNPLFRKVDGIEGWDGEIIGQLANDSKFRKLQIGMTIVQVVAQLGPPDDQSFNSTALTEFAWVKFGPGRYRSDYSYNGTGRLSFSTEASAGLGEMRLEKIIHRREEGTKTAYADVADDQIVAYQAVVEQKCQAHSKQQGNSASTAESRCGCMLKTFKDNLKKDEWQQATFYFLQGREREEVAVVSGQVQRVKACQQSAP